MYVEIKDNKLLSWCENPYLDYQFVDIDYATFNPQRYEVQEGVLVDVSNTPEYLAAQEALNKENLKKELEQRLGELDIKRIRAICEPQIKEMETGQTWLEYYNQQIKALREQIALI